MPQIRIKSSNSRSKYINAILIVLTAFFSSGSLLAKEGASYDEYFKNYTSRYFGKTLDWRLFKAQAIAESRLQHKARSHRGATGIMQIMPATYKEIQKKNSFYQTKTLASAETNIGAGIYFNAYLFDRWNREVSENDRVKLMLASYNGGYVRVLRAFNKAGQPENDWDAVAKHLPKETRIYVDRVLHLHNAQKAQIAAPNQSQKILASSETQPAK